MPCCSRACRSFRLRLPRRDRAGSRNSSPESSLRGQLVGKSEALEGGGESEGIERLLGQPRDDAAIRVLRGARQERVDLADSIAAQGQDVERESKVTRRSFVPAVEGERLLAVGTSADVTPAPLARERPAGEEHGDRVAASEPASKRRHRERGV